MKERREAVNKVAVTVGWSTDAYVSLTCLQSVIELIDDC